MFDKKAYMKPYRAEHKERIKIWAVSYYQKNKERFQEYQRQYRKEHKEEYNQRNQKYKASHKEIIRAENQARQQIPLGTKCAKCGSIDNLVRHHPDYSKPLENATFCHTCNVNERILGK